AGPLHSGGRFSYRRSRTSKDRGVQTGGKRIAYSALEQIRARSRSNDPCRNHWNDRRSAGSNEVTRASIRNGTVRQIHFTLMFFRRVVVISRFAPSMLVA